jgi:hypothetical protein
MQRDFLQRCDNCFVAGENVWQRSFGIESLVAYAAHLGEEALEGEIIARHHLTLT